jgi:hypothetical protein
LAPGHNVIKLFLFVIYPYIAHLDYFFGSNLFYAAIRAIVNPEKNATLNFSSLDQVYLLVGGIDLIKLIL